MTIRSLPTRSYALKPPNKYSWRDAGNCTRGRGGDACAPRTSKAPRSSQTMTLKSPRRDLIEVVGQASRIASSLQNALCQSRPVRNALGAYAFHPSCAP